MNNGNIRNGLLYLDERGWSELIDPRWTLDVYEELQLSGLGLSDEEMREVIDVVCHPEPDWNTTEHLSHKEEYLPTDKDRVFTSIKYNGFTPHTLQLIDNYISNIYNGNTNFDRFNTPEHAGLCSAGKVLIGAETIVSYARASLDTGRDAGKSKATVPNWQIDETQEKFVEQWAQAAGFWFEDSEQQIIESFGPKIAQGAEAKVYYQSGEPCVIKERTSIYSTLQKAFDAIALHNYFFPESPMQVIGFSRDAEGLFRTILTQPYIQCERLAAKEEIYEYVTSKGLRLNEDGFKESFVSDRHILEDMHPANVFIDAQSGKPICIDCIVKFK